MKSGYRKLTVGEIIQEGDIYLSSDGEWKEAPIHGVPVVNNGVEWATPLVNGILWNVFASFVKDDRGDKCFEGGEPVVQLEWGWTTGMTPAQVAECAEDAPKGKDFVQLTFTDAVSLRDKLNELITEYHLENSLRDNKELLERL